MALDTDHTPSSAQESANLRFLRRLVTMLTAVMILGMITISILLVIRLQAPPLTPVWPPELMLPDGAKAISVAAGEGWFMVVTEAGQVLVFDRQGKLISEAVVQLP